MSNAARKIADENRQNHQPQTTVRTVVVHKAKVTLGEKVLLIMFALVIAAFSVKIISNQFEIYTLNKEIQTTQQALTDQTKVNNDLNVQVSELSTYERIWEKASQLGLTLDENNVKVVED